jgi:branched-chain amino acid transport system ATP-binding protein
MTVLDNVQTVALSARRRLQSLRPAVARAGLDEAYALLERVGIGGEAERPCNTLSYGDLKRVELAMALVNRPRLLLMDEPTAGMAPGERRGLMALVHGIARSEQIGVLFTEHDMDVVFGHADRVLVVDRGALVAAGTPDAVRASRAVQDVYLGHGGRGGAP